MFVIGQVKSVSDSLDLEQPTKPLLRAVNNQSYWSILLLTQLDSNTMAYSLSSHSFVNAGFHKLTS